MAAVAIRARRLRTKRKDRARSIARSIALEQMLERQSTPGGFDRWAWKFRRARESRGSADRVFSVGLPAGLATEGSE